MEVTTVEAIMEEIMEETWVVVTWVEDFEMAVIWLEFLEKVPVLISFICHVTRSIITLRKTNVCSKSRNSFQSILLIHPPN